MIFAEILCCGWEAIASVEQRRLVASARAFRRMPQRRVEYSRLSTAGPIFRRRKTTDRRKQRNIFRRHCVKSMAWRSTVRNQ